jgi:hypothetical protein
VVLSDDIRDLDAPGFAACARLLGGLLLDCAGGVLDRRFAGPGVLASISAAASASAAFCSASWTRRSKRSTSSDEFVEPQPASAIATTPAAAHIRAVLLIPLLPVDQRLHLSNVWSAIPE